MIGMLKVLFVSLRRGRGRKLAEKRLGGLGKEKTGLLF